MSNTKPGQYRVLVVDDNKSIHQDLRKIFAPAPAAEDELAADEALLFH